MCSLTPLVRHHVFAITRRLQLCGRVVAGSFRAVLQLKLALKMLVVGIAPTAMHNSRPQPQRLLPALVVGG